jgi:hypothetical protein
MIHLRIFFPLHRLPHHLRMHRSPRAYSPHHRLLLAEKAMDAPGLMLLSNFVIMDLMYMSFYFVVFLYTPFTHCISWHQHCITHSSLHNYFRVVTSTYNNCGYTECNNNHIKRSRLKIRCAQSISTAKQIDRRSNHLLLINLYVRNTHGFAAGIPEAISKLS